MASSSAKDLVKRYGIALTGGVATGKSTVAAMIAKSGYHVVDADQLAREVVAVDTPGLAAIVKTFGPAVLAGDGTLDRKRLGTLVFADPARRQALEAITHPLIRQALADHLERLGLAKTPKPFFYEAALIFETRTESDFRAVWATVCAPETQLARLVKRGGLAEDAARRIIAQQLPAADKAARADAVIRTDGTIADVAAQVQALLKLGTHD